MTRAFLCRKMSRRLCPDLNIGIRGHDIAFSFERQEGWIRGSVYANEPIGNKVIMSVSVGGTLLRLVAPNDTMAELDSPVYVKLNHDNFLYFDRANERFIIRKDMESVLRSPAERQTGEGDI